MDAVAAVITSLGQGTLLAKIDIRAAYRLIPVHPDDRPLLGIEWEGSAYCDAMLPFGLRSAAKIFTAVADSIEWILRRRGVVHIAHYLDDFIILGTPHSSRCADSLKIVVDTCAELGVPLALDKCEGLRTRLTFLGIELDTETWSLRLPRDKLTRIQDTLDTWRERKVCRRKELESLVGLLHHACKVIRPGRSFLRRSYPRRTTDTSSGSTELFVPTSHGGACLLPTGMEPGLSLRIAPHHPPRCSRTLPVRGDVARSGTSAGFNFTGANRPPLCRYR